MQDSIGHCITRYSWTIVTVRANLPLLAVSSSPLTPTGNGGRVSSSTWPPVFAGLALLVDSNCNKWYIWVVCDHYGILPLEEGSRVAKVTRLSSFILDDLG